MPIIWMVRHGEAAAGYNEHADPGLSDRGRAQAEDVVAKLAAVDQGQIASSPMARARETAVPLGRAWGEPIELVPAVSEIPSPGLSPTDRSAWLQGVMAGTWTDASDDLRRWRRAIEATLLARRADTVIFSHYVAINAAISLATGADTPRCQHLDHCSITVLSNDGGRLELLDLGESADTEVL